MANFNFNKIILGGRLTADPELKQTQSGIPVVSFTVAVNRRYQPKDKDAANSQPQADFFNVTAWRSTAEFVSRYFHKGSSICVVGSLQNRSWTDQQNVKHYATDVVADEVMFVDSRNESGNANVAPQSAPYTPDAYSATPAFSTPQNSAPNFEEVKTDDDLPF